MFSAKVVRFIVLSVILAFAGSLTFAQKNAHDNIRRLIFERGRTDAVLRGVLRPYTNHIYRFRARAGQKMSVRLHLAEKRAEEAGDVAFWVQSRDHLLKNSTAILEGIDPKGGETSWSGELPMTGEYEIYLANPEISDHVIKRALHYTLEVEIK